MNWIRRQLNEILGLLFLGFGITPTDAMKEQLGIAVSNETKPTSDQKNAGPKDADEKDSSEK